MKYDFLIVGAGFSGAVCARQLADSGGKVLIIDKRPHIGGNAFDMPDQKGVLIHLYGPHIFHTNSKRIFDYLSRFTEWIPYEHRVLAQVDGQLYPIPINRTTINRLYGLKLVSEEETSAFFEKTREPKDTITTSEDVVLNSVGRDLCNKFFRGYTFKQWGLDLSELSAGVAARIPTRTNDDDRYFSDTYQYMPDHGYTELFKRLINHRNITLQLATPLYEAINITKWRHMIYTGPIDAFFDFQFGKLPYRSIRFEHEHFPNKNFFQSVGTINYPNDHAYTRITEFKHITKQPHTGTSIVKEYPTSVGEPYYPVPCAENEITYRKYHELANKLESVSFVGRLAQYRYYNMDQVIAAALAVSDRLLDAQI